MLGAGAAQSPRASPHASSPLPAPGERDVGALQSCDARPPAPRVPRVPAGIDAPRQGLAREPSLFSPADAFGHLSSAWTTPCPESLPTQAPLVLSTHRLFFKKKKKKKPYLTASYLCNSKKRISVVKLIDILQTPSQGGGRVSLSGAGSAWPWHAWPWGNRGNGAGGVSPAFLGLLGLKPLCAWLRAAG